MSPSTKLAVTRACRAELAVPSVTDRLCTLYLVLSSLFRGGWKRVGQKAFTSFRLHHSVSIIPFPSFRLQHVLPTCWTPMYPQCKIYYKVRNDLNGNVLEYGNGMILVCTRILRRSDPCRPRSRIPRTSFPGKLGNFWAYGRIGEELGKNGVVAYRSPTFLGGE